MKKREVRSDGALKGLRGISVSLSAGVVDTYHLVHLFLYIEKQSLSVKVCYIVGRIAAVTTRKEASEMARTPDPK